MKKNLKQGLLVLLSLMLLLAQTSLAFSESPNVQHKTIQLSNGETYAYREQGSGDKVLVLLHGNMSSSLHWDVLMEKLPLEEYRVIAPDLRGFGDSTYNTPVESIRDYSQDIKLLADALSLEGFTLGGWSLGGLIALQYAADYPDDVSGLVLVAATSKAVPIAKTDTNGMTIEGEYYYTKEEIAALNANNLMIMEAKSHIAMQYGLDFVVYNMSKPEPERYTRYLDEIFKQRNLVDVAYVASIFNISHENNALVDGTGEIDKVTCPVLLLHGQNDFVVPFVYGEALAAEIGENARLVPLHAGHSPLTDAIDIMVEEITQFMSR